MTTRFAALLALGLAAISSGCAATRALAPVGAKNVAMTVSVGGPFVEYAGAPVPLPDMSVGAIYGLDDRTNLHGAAYLPTRALLFGLATIDLGASRELVTPEGARPRVMADATVYLSYGNLGGGTPKGGFRAFPDLSAVASWPIGHTTPFVGVDVLVDAWRPAVHPAPFVGAEIRAGRSFGFEPEIAWQDPWRRNDVYPLTFFGPGHRGAIALHLGFNIYFGRREQP